MDKIKNATKGHASIEVKYHAVYVHFFLGKSKKEVARCFNKAPSTVGEWVKEFKEHDGFNPKERKVKFRKLTPEKRQWVLDYYNKNPVAFLEETKDAYREQWGQEVSTVSIWRILRAAGLTWKVLHCCLTVLDTIAVSPRPIIYPPIAQKLERRAIQIRMDAIVRFLQELDSIDWSPANIFFLDEVSFDNRGMRRTHGYGQKGAPLVVAGEYARFPRVSMLCFISINGLVDAFTTEGTFTRKSFLDCCLEMLARPDVTAYPGPGSVWILDGAKIHCHPNIVQILREAGIVPIFLPPYCPFWNPIEIFFGIVKRKLRRSYAEGKLKPKELEGFVNDVMFDFIGEDFTNLFAHCGYEGVRLFNPSRNFDEAVSVVAV